MVKFLLGLRQELARAVAIKHSSVNQGPHGYHCATFHGNWLAPNETLP